MNPAPNRRKFLATTMATGAALTLPAASYARIKGANERISIGLIGCGNRGHGVQIPFIAKHASAENVEITAASDPWQVSRDHAAAGIQDHFGVQARLCESHDELLGMKDIDAVMITSCDHQHARQLEAAVQAGKDVYCEKPIAKNIEELNRTYDAVKETGQVVQAGTQLRSLSSVSGARSVYQSGVLGNVSRIEQRRNGNRPFWYNYIRDVKRQDVNWNEFVMGASKREFDPVAYSAWMGYGDFCDGPIPQLAVHFMDAVHFITGAVVPETCVCHGGLFTWKDENKFDVPDHVQALWTYPEGFMVSFSTNFGNGTDNTIRFSGDEGTLDLTDWNKPRLLRSGHQEDIEPISRPDHWLDWLQCLRSRKSPNASIEAGYYQTIPCLMAVKAYETGRRMVFDPQRRTIEEG
ncbi:MAG: Gfo/Idh/MocA family oxidoreductase [Pirellulaceae bacterium]|nr:Gfo/Idh/MocA family oxidoreductase [Pirellulaceae bacterium]